MRIHKHGLRSLAVLLTVLLVVYTMPLSAADGTSRATSIGQVSVGANGAVDLRGVRISGDGTLFSGDRMNVGSGAYAKVALVAGARMEVDSGSDVTVTREADNIQVTMASGNVAFKGGGKAPVHVRVGAFEITVPGNASGSVAYIGKSAFGVRVLTGSFSVRNTLTKKSFSVEKGVEQLVSLQTGDVSQPLARLASSVPSAIPALPQGGQGSGGLSKGGWLAVLGTVAGATAAVIVLTTRNDDTDDDAATRLAQVKAVQNLNAMAATAGSISTAAATVTTTANAALSAINASSASNKAALAALANTSITQANSATAKIAIFNPRLTSLQNEIANQHGAPTSAQQTQINQLFADLESARADVNNSINSLNSTLTQSQAAGVSGLPANPNLQPVQPPVIASASAPN